MTTEIQDPRKGRTSASNAQADSLCQWRYKMQQGLTAPPSPEASFGIRVHDALAKESPDGLTVEEQAVYESCVEIRDRKLAEFFGPDLAGLTHWNHRRFWIKFSASVPDRPILEHSGEADAVYRKGGKLLILDYKSLGGDVPDSTSNLQLRDLAVLATKELIADEAGVLIVQPMVTRNPDITLYTAADLAQAKEELYKRVEASNYPEGQPVAGEVQCRYCLAKTKCLSYTRLGGTSVPAMLSLVDLPVEQWKPEERKAFCDRRATAQEWLDATWAFMEKGMAQDPAFVPGYILKPGNVVETITEPQIVFERFVKLGGTPEAFVSIVKVTKSGLEEQLAEITKLKGKKLKDAIKALVEGCVTPKQNKSSLRKAEGA